ncbi:head-tail connector protein [Citroniella saccharovorans]|uniref:Head-tail connector protein n=1 Tax=Citroniella saccharovorans TaxID=2053367 RepID=A0AAW9MSL0_9FIRM|nr:head-tail connector protein [Citroniella saccharovorans]MEB3428868.1 head-tail connector protein [Citroniella saccharovorans]MEB3428915.1 head-tail connector protein [Citroniella saccharovorans]MEB3430245.1 head-tail connector protein [Citroniella saccharovorans]
MLDKIKLDLRISHDLIDEDIEDNIEACKLDLKRVGIVKIDDEDPLIIKAIKLWCRYQYNFENEGDRYNKAYSMLRDALSLCGDYNVQ